MNELNVRITQMLGGGSSWFYLMVDGKCYGASHKEDKKGMDRLIKKETELRKLNNG